MVDRQRRHRRSLSPNPPSPAATRPGFGEAGGSASGRHDFDETDVDELAAGGLTTMHGDHVDARAQRGAALGSHRRQLVVRRVPAWPSGRARRSRRSRRPRRDGPGTAAPSTRWWPAASPGRRSQMSALFHSVPTTRRASMRVAEAARAGRPRRVVEARGHPAVGAASTCVAPRGRRVARRSTIERSAGGGVKSARFAARTRAASGLMTARS